MMSREYCKSKNAFRGDDIRVANRYHECDTKTLNTIVYMR